METAIRENAIKQAEIAEELGLRPSAVKGWRDKNLVRGEDWYKDGVTVYWTQEAAAAFRAAANVRPAIEPPEPPAVAVETLTMRIIGVARNARYAHGDLNGNRVSVFCARVKPARLVGKTVTVEATREGDSVTYRHRP